MTVTDDELLMNMGYRPELKRQFSLVEVFGLSLSLMSIVPGITAVFYDSLIAGGVGLSWGWFVPCIFITCVAISMSELASSLPTAGGLYWWTYKFAPKSYKKVLSFFVGYANLFGLIGSICSINYGFASMLMSLPSISQNGNFVPTKFETFAVYALCLITHTIVACLNTSFATKSQWGLIFANILLIFLFAIALPIGKKNNDGHLNSASYVFGDTTNTSDWSYGWSYLLSWMSPIWVISSVDGVVHIAEEATNAATAIPFAVVGSTVCCWLFGFLVMCVIAAVINQDFDTIINSPTGQPMAQVLFDTLGKKWSLGLMTIMTVVQWLVGLSIVVATSRLTFSLARDKALPFSRILRKVSPQAIPIWSVVFNNVVALLIGLLILIGPEAASAVFTIPVSSCGLAWFTPIFLRAFVAPASDFVPGPFYLGAGLSKIVAAVSSVYLIFVVGALANMPRVKHVDADSMNYTVVINCAIWILCLVYYFVDARRWFEGPQITLDAEDGVVVKDHLVRLEDKPEHSFTEPSVDTTVEQKVIS